MSRKDCGVVQGICIDNAFRRRYRSVVNQKNNESMVLGIWPDIRNVDQVLVSTSDFLSNISRLCIHTPYAFCYLPRPSCDFFLCFGYRRSISVHGGDFIERRLDSTALEIVSYTLKFS